mgnify:CR=1 FL=1|jgi:hypothetical protein
MKLLFTVLALSAAEKKRPDEITVGKRADKLELWSGQCLDMMPVKNKGGAQMRRRFAKLNADVRSYIENMTPEESEETAEEVDAEDGKKIIFQIHFSV